MARVIRPKGGVPLVQRFAFAVFVVVSVVLLLGGLGNVGSQTGPGVAFLCLGLLTGAGAWSMHRGWRGRRRPGLTLSVAADRLEVSHDGGHADVVAKADIGLIVLHQFVRPGRTSRGLVDLEIFRPDRSSLGRWHTGWSGRRPLRSIRALRRYGYPWIVHDMGGLVSERTRRSELAPPWAADVLGADRSV